MSFSDADLFDEPIPLFPLSGCVLLPHATAPLHVFEQRYRDMTRDAIEGRKLIAMASFDGQDWPDDYEGRPPIRETVCVGMIQRHQELPDGRYYLLLQGLCRARVVDELPHEPYRVGMLESIEMETVWELDLEETRKTIDDLLGDTHLKQLAAVAALRNACPNELPTPALIDLATMALTRDGEERYAMLAEPNTGVRAEWLTGHLKQLRKTLALAAKTAGQDEDAGYHLN